jgi:DNA-binding SARP family transcriptional activator/TolB-like protein
MLFLRTFGGLSLEKDREPIVVGVAAQRGRLAILAVLASSAGRGFSRDRLLPLFWPESDEERARGALKQAIYSVRRAAGQPELVTGTTELRLNPTVIASDVEEFEASVSAGDLERAAAAYRGPFLDGIHLKGLEEFERWSEEERIRLARLYASVLRRLATSRTAEGDSEAAVEWWRRLASVDPLDSQVAASLVGALDSVGDITGALRFAAAFEERCRAELGVDPPQRFSEVVARLKNRTASGARTESPAASLHIEGNSALPSDAAVPTPIESSHHAAPAAALAQPRRSRTVLAIGALAVLAIGMGLMRIARADSGASLPTDDELVAIAPFRVTPPTGALQYLHSGMSDLLAAAFANDSSFRIVESSRGIAEDKAGAMHGAASAGAGRVVIGSVSGDERHVVLSASLLDSRTGAVRARASEAGEVDSLPAMIDRLATRLFGSDIDPSVSFSALGAIPTATLRDYVDAQAALRRADYPRAVRSFMNALAADSTFALAALGLRIAAGWIPDRAAQADGDRIAWQWRAKLSAADRAYLVGVLGPSYPERSWYRESLAAWERAVRLGPGRAESWFELGDIHLHAGPILGEAHADSLAMLAFARAVRIDSSFVPALEHLAELTAATGDTATSHRYVRQALAAHPSTDVERYLRWRIGDTLIGRDASQRSRAADPNELATVRRIALSTIADGARLDEGTQMLETFLRNAPRSEDRVEALVGLHAIAVNRGRLADAAAYLRTMESIGTARHQALRLMVLDALYTGGDNAESVRAAAILGAALDQGSPSDADAILDRCVRGQRWSALGERSRAVNDAQVLEQIGARNRATAVGVEARVCSQLVSTSVAVERKDPGAHAAISRLDSVIQRGPQSTTLLGSYAPLAVAMLFERAGDAPAALGAVRRRPYLFPWPIYLADELAMEVRLATAVSDTAGERRATVRLGRLRGGAVQQAGHAGDNRHERE